MSVNCTSDVTRRRADALFANNVSQRHDVVIPIWAALWNAYISALDCETVQLSISTVTLGS